jgi:DNA-directed RNA polymerase subunit H (RpoH/RPB5)
MAKGIRKRKFSNNQIVVFRFGERNLVGKICDIKQIGKRTFIYDVKGEDGIIYEELGVDAVMNHTIDTHKTKLFYKKYNISEDQMPEIEQEDVELEASIDSETEEVVETSSKTDEETLFSDEDTDPNW